MRITGTSADSLCVSSVPREFERVALAFAAHTALSHGDHTLSYAALNARANQVARQLVALGVRRDDPVGLCCERSLEMIVFTLAILKAGAAYLPLDPDYPVARLRMMLDDAQAPLVIVQDNLADCIPEGTARRLLANELQHAAQSEDDANLSESPAPNDLAYIMYTSGSTGTPKGVGVEHGNVLGLVCGADYVDLGPEEVLLQFAPISFDASTFEIWGALLNGARLAIAPPGPLSVEDLGNVLRAEAVTTLWLTAGLFHLVVDESVEQLRGLRQILAGGDVLSADHVRRLLLANPGGRVINGYGPTECTTFACTHQMRSANEVTDPVPIGRPIAHASVYILDEQMTPAQQGEAGELFIGGTGVSRGYLNHPDLTARHFLPDPFSDAPGARMYRTGDLVRLSRDKTLIFLGRKDRQVKIRGFRIEPGETERVLMQCGEVAQALVVPLGEEAHEKQLVAYIKPSENATRSTQVVMDWLRSQLPVHMLPTAVLWLDSLPLDPNGKVDRNALPAPSHMSRADYVPPATDPERLIARAWTETLGVNSIGRDDDFYALGGHSLAAMRVTTRLNDIFGIRLALRVLLQHTTVRTLAEAVEDAVLTQLEEENV